MQRKRERYERVDFCFVPEKEEQVYYAEIDNAHRGLMAEIDKILKITFPSKYKRKTNRRLSEKIRARNEIVKNVMKERNLLLGQASKYVKDHGLWS